MSLIKGFRFVKDARSFFFTTRRFSSSKTGIERIHHGKVALVTGSSDRRGIGFGAARSLAQRGCSVILAGTRGSEKVKVLQDELQGECGIPVHYFQADFSNLSTVKKLYEDIKHIFPDGVDILVNNAGVVTVKSVENSSVDSWEGDMRIMLTVPFYLTKLCLPDMKNKAWGKIVNISSALGLDGASMYSIYTAAKHGLNGLTKVTALETLGTGVTCNAVCPGAVHTEMYDAELVDYAKETGVPLEELLKTALQSFNPSGQFVGQDQIGELVAFLCSPAADQMTGTTLPIDAGFGAS
ncbi:D-beta-hydroxybutyrate dehydrogenase-like [Glandiceps talaboti]